MFFGGISRKKGAIENKIISLIPILILIVSVYTLVYTIEIFFEKNDVIDTLIWIIPIFFLIIFSLMTFSFFYSIKDFKKIFQKIDKKTWIVILIIFIVGLSLRTFYAPHTHRLYFDEDIYLNIGQNIAREGKNYLCNFGSQTECFDYIYNKQPSGYSFFISIFYFLFGTSETMAHYINAIVSSLTTILVFLLAYLLFKSEKVGIFASLIFIFIPVAIRWAPTTSTGTIFIFFMALTVLGFLCYFKTYKNNILLFSFAALAYTIQFRPEGLLLVPIILLLFLIHNKEIFSKIKSKEFMIIITVFSLLIIPHMIHLNTVKDEKWGTEGEKMSTEYFEKNFKDNALFFFENTRFPITFTFFAIIGLAFRNFWKKKIFLILWFLTFFGIYLLFYAGSFNFGVDVRYSLPIYVQISILGGCGVFLLYKLLKKIIKKEAIAIIISGLLIVLSFVPFIGFSGSVGIEAWHARLSHDFLVEKMEEMEDDSWIFTLVPSIVLINGKNGLQGYYAQDSEIIKEIFEKTDNVYLYSGYWCNSDPWKSSICKYFHENINLTLIDTTTDTHKRQTMTFTLYKISKN